LDYFRAVQEGKIRIQSATQLLKEVAGESYPVLFLKTGRVDWIPVGEENLYALVNGKNDTAAVVLCDIDGNAKAMSAWIGRDSASKSASLLAQKGVSKYEGEVKLPI
jgi:hypothetical protein